MNEAASEKKKSLCATAESSLYGIAGSLWAIGFRAIPHKVHRDFRSFEYDGNIENTARPDGNSL